MRGQAIAISQISLDTGITIGAMAMGPIALFSGYPTAFIFTATITILGTVAFLGIRTAWKKEEKIYT